MPQRRKSSAVETLVRAIARAFRLSEEGVTRDFGLTELIDFGEAVESRRAGKKRKAVHKAVVGAKRKRGGRRAAVTRTLKRRKAEARKKAGTPVEPKWLEYDNTRMKRRMLFGVLDVPGPYGALTAEQIAELAGKLFDAARDEAQRNGMRVELWAGGYLARISTRNDSDGNPIWEDEVARNASGYRRSFEKAKKESMSLIRSIATGERLQRRGDERRHYYRIWIYAVTVYMAGERQ